ncbi:MAG: hypothetical protein M1834_000862 [Cirrosporium novae-zelandiae]|nr:MAG: hypothetical protein M1834_000862 [Cirrosporium novae-zelandiae]
MRAFETTFFARVTFHLTLFYKRDEIVFRMAIFFGSVQIADATLRPPRVRRLSNRRSQSCQLEIAYDHRG